MGSYPRKNSDFRPLFCSIFRSGFLFYFLCCRRHTRISSFFRVCVIMSQITCKPHARTSLTPECCVLVAENVRWYFEVRSGGRPSISQKDGNYKSTRKTTKYLSMVYFSIHPTNPFLSSSVSLGDNIVDCFCFAIYYFDAGIDSMTLYFIFH